jgi:regulator of RNase E activity RraA
VDVGGEVTISGMHICLGDLLHGDVNGVVHIPDECADQVAEAAYRIWTEEGETLRRIAGPEFTTFSGPEVKH